MKCKWILVIAALITLMAGYYLGDYRARRLAYNQLRLFVSARLEFELLAQENAAFYAYLNEPPAVAAWALEDLIHAYQRYTVNVFDITGNRDPTKDLHIIYTAPMRGVHQTVERYAACAARLTADVVQKEKSIIGPVRAMAHQASMVR